MKLTEGQVESFLRKPGADVAAVLFFGPDRGLVRERADRLAKVVVGDADDPFRVSDLSAQSIKEDPARLADDAGALSLDGGRRLVRVRDAADAVAKALGPVLEGPGGGALVILEAGELQKRSALRKTVEAAKHGVAVGCYGDEGRRLSDVISETLGRHGLRASPDAVAFLSSHLGADRALTRQELDKLALYKNFEGTVELDDALAVVGDAAGVSLDQLCLAVAGGNAEALETTLERLRAEGTQPVAVLRAAGRYFTRLHQARAAMAKGASADMAVKGLRPPVLFTIAKPFRRHLELWNADALARALERLMQAEIECKTTGMPAEAIAGRALLGLCQYAKNLSRRR